MKHILIFILYSLFIASCTTNLAASPDGWVSLDRKNKYYYESNSIHHNEDNTISVLVSVRGTAIKKTDIDWSMRYLTKINCSDKTMIFPSMNSYHGEFGDGGPIDPKKEIEVLGLYSIGFMDKNSLDQFPVVKDFYKPLFLAVCE